MIGQGKFLGSSVGRKAVMAISGLMLCGFLLVHLIGNITLLIADSGHLTATPGGPQAGEHFIGVVQAYGKIPALLYFMETLLGALFALHIVLGVSLWIKNRRARGSSYVVHRAEGGRTIGSATMPYTGALVIFSFLILHLIQFRLAGVEAKEMYGLVDQVLGNWLWALIYLAALLGLALHLSHGFQSAFQSLGLRHERHTPRIRKLGWLYSLLVLAGFGVLPALFILKGVGA